jgi:hypothetical protein
MKSLKSVVNKVLALSKSIFTPLALMFVGYFAWQSKDLLSGLIKDTNYTFLLASILCWALTHFVSPFFSMLLMRGFSNHLTYRDAFLIHATRLPAKYLPGGVWHTVARAVDYKSRGVPMAGISYYLVLEHLVAASVTLFAGGGIVLAAKAVGGNWIVPVVVMVVVAGLALIVLPGVLARLRSYKMYSISVTSYFQGVMIMGLFWLLASVSFVLFINAFDVGLVDYSSVSVGGVYLFSWGVGFLAVFAPQGVGVSEFVSGTLLRPEIPLTSFMVILASFRINIFFADMTVWIIAKRIRQ